jgi:hypothetical protein
MRFRCPACDQPLDEYDLPGGAGTCPRCGQAIRAPGAVSQELDRPAPRRRPPDEDEDEDRPRRRRLDVSRPPAGPPSRWPRFVSPSMMVLALLTLPLPWLEVRCQGGGSGSSTPRFHYSQTGLQMMADQQTDLAAPPPGSPPREPRPFRQVGTILWAVTLLAGAVTALAGRGLVWNIVHACCAAFALILLPALILGIIFGEVANSVTLTPWPLIAFLACVGAMAGSLVTLIREWPARTRPIRFDDEFD